MNIPIENIYFLLCYAWDRLAEKEIVNVDPIESTSLADLFAKVLVSGTNHLVKRGFDRGYVTHSERVTRLRGRIIFNEVARARPGKGTLPCEFDELSYDVLHNQIIKAIGRRLVRTVGLPTATAESLTSLNRRLADVADIEVTNRAFGQVQLHRNNQFYDFLLKVCELIHRNMLVADRSGPSKFMDFVRDQRQMAYLFEAFVRNFYRVHTSYTVKREDINWRWIAADKVAAGLLPKMQTDISLMSDARKIIVDCKFMPEATQTHYDAETLRSAHLFQISSYLENQPDERFRNSCEGMLLYPTVNKTLTASYTDKGRVISIRTINLNQSWQGIHDDLVALVA